MMKFPYIMENHKIPWFQTTNQNIIMVNIIWVNHIGDDKLIITKHIPSGYLT